MKGAFMDEANKFALVFGKVIDGIESDAAELMRVAKIDKETLREVVSADRASEHGSVSIGHADFAAVKILAAMGVAVEARKALENGDLLYAAAASAVGQRFISSAAGVLLGIQIGENSRDQKAVLRQFAIAGADAIHNRPGGSREKKAAIRAAWASGKYTNRTRCAEEECSALGMSYDAARKALRNMPNPA